MLKFMTLLTLSLASPGLSAEGPSPSGDLDVAHTGSLLELLRDPTTRPREVSLTSDVTVPIVIDGRQVGTIPIPAGTRVQLMGVAGQKVKISHQGKVHTMPLSSTDLFRRLEEIGKSRETTADSKNPEPSRAARSGLPLTVVNQSDEDLDLKIIGYGNSVTNSIPAGSTVVLYLDHGIRIYSAGSFSADGRVKPGKTSRSEHVTVKGRETWIFTQKDNFGVRMWNLDRRSTESEALATAAGTNPLTGESDTRWASLVLDILNEDDAKICTTLATLQISLSQPSATDLLGMNMAAMTDTQWSIADIQKKHGAPDQVKTTVREEKDAKVDVQRYAYGLFILETRKDEDPVIWMYAPAGFWANGIRQTAEKALGRTK